MRPNYPRPELLPIFPISHSLSPLTLLFLLLSRRKYLELPLPSPSTDSPSPSTVAGRCSPDSRRCCSVVAAAPSSPLLLSREEPLLVVVQPSPGGALLPLPAVGAATTAAGRRCLRSAPSSAPISPRGLRRRNIFSRRRKICAESLIKIGTKDVLF